MTPPARQIIEDQAREASTAEPECTCALYNWDPNCPPYTERHYSACPRYRAIRIVTVGQIAHAARALLDVVDHPQIRGAAIQASLPLYERAATLIDLLAALEITS